MDEQTTFRPGDRVRIQTPHGPVEGIVSGAQVPDDDKTEPAYTIDTATGPMLADEGELEHLP